MPHFCYLFSALESKLVSQFCEDENGALIYNHITNGLRNGNNGHSNAINGNNGHGDSGHNGHSFDSHGNNRNSYNEQEEIQNERHHSSRGRGDTFILPISADPLPVKVFATNENSILANAGELFTVLTNMFALM